MTGILDLAGIRARAEAATPGPWNVSPYDSHIYAPSEKGGDAKIFDIRGWGYFTGKGHGALGLSFDEGRARQAANGAHVAGMDPPTVIAMCDEIERQAGEIARLKAEVAECKRAAVKAVVPLEAMRMAGTSQGFCPELRDGVDRGIEAVRAIVTPKEETSCRTA